MRYIKPCKGSSTEFANPNSCDVFGLVDGKLEFIRREFANEEEEIFCRKCSKKQKLK